MPLRLLSRTSFDTSSDARSPIARQESAISMVGGNEFHHDWIAEARTHFFGLHFAPLHSQENPEPR
jgi:hypothetical protein